MVIVLIIKLHIRTFCDEFISELSNKLKVTLSLWLGLVRWVTGIPDGEILHDMSLLYIFL